MARPLALLQIGKGTVGATLIGQVAAGRRAVRDALAVDLIYVGIAGRAGAAFAAGGIDLERWREAVAAGPAVDARTLVREAGAIGGPKVLIDATAAEGMADLYVEAFAAGYHVVACNKKPIAGSLADWRRLRSAARAAGRLFLYEVTAGAGLPTIGTLRDMVDSGDRVVSIEGCFSGTLNYLCAGLDRGGRFSAVLREAIGRGYTEPDPREDLSGMDVARKALILAREAGLLIGPEDVRREPFCPIDGGDAAGFAERAAALDGDLRRAWEESAARGRRRRYVAEVGAACSAGLREVPADGPLGRLQGPENIFVFRTERYQDAPLVIAGPGAGPAVTAAGAFADILRVARAVGAGHDG